MEAYGKAPMYYIGNMGDVLDLEAPVIWILQQYFHGCSVRIEKNTKLCRVMPGNSPTEHRSCLL